jgi:HSP20 family molecular chaperone IbpA
MDTRNELATKEEKLKEAARRLPVVAPLVDIFENKEEILLYADMPGVDKKDISIDIDNGKLTINGIRRMVKTGAATWEEFGDAEYQRTFAVPQTIDLSKVAASLVDGVLQLHLPKSEAAKPKKIEITAN